MVLKAKTRKLLAPGQLLLSFCMLFFILIILVPLLNILARSISDPALSGAMNGMQVIPQGLSTLNYRIIFNHKVIVPSIFNSVNITLTGTAINILLTTTAAYVLIQRKLVGRKAIMTFLIIMMLFDPGLVPEYLVIKDLGLIGSHWSIILVTAVNVYYLIIMMRYFEAVPSEMYEAARIDGAGHLRTLSSIVIPLAKPGIATITMFYAVARWNEYFKASIYLTQQAKTTLQVVLRQFVVLSDTVNLIGSQNLAEYNEFARVDYTALKSATIVVAIIPILLLYPLVLKYYTSDIMAGGVKG